MGTITDTKFKTVNEYLSACPPKARRLLKELRITIKQAAPEVEELISYNMPAFKFHGILVYYAAHKEHIGFYPGSSVITGIFKDDLKDFKTSKGTIQFPIDKILPLRLINKIVKYRVIQNLERENAKMGKKE